MEISKEKHIHFIGICGVAMSALAILWHKKGWRVTGSDAGFYPPISTHLQKNNITFYPGWHPEKMGTPDLVVVGNVAASENPELIFVKTHNIPHLSYPELIAAHLVKKNSIVCAGSYGKTSSTALLSLIFKNSGRNASYMFGGLSLDLETSADDFPETEWSILEGDEYKTSRENPVAKFFSYAPTHLLLTSVEWDHADVYKTEADYFAAFSKLMNLIPTNGLIVACTDHETIRQLINDLPVHHPKLISYGQNALADYRYHNLTETKDGLEFDITYKNTTFHFTSPVLGAYMAENICGAFALAHYVGLPIESLQHTIAHFHGLKRRLEKRGSINGTPIFDTIAHSPAKAKSVLESLKKIYSGKIIALFEPNTGNRYKEALPNYANAFAAADEVIIPRLTKVKTNPSDISLPVDGSTLCQTIRKTHPTTHYIDDDEKVVHEIKQKIDPNGAVVFMGSHGFRGMIEELLK